MGTFKNTHHPIAGSIDCQQANAENTMTGKLECLIQGSCICIQRFANADSCYDRICNIGTVFFNCAYKSLSPSLKQWMGVQARHHKHGSYFLADVLMPCPVL